MSTAIMHKASRARLAGRRKSDAAGPIPIGHRRSKQPLIERAPSVPQDRPDDAPRLSTTPLSDPADILPQMPAQALSPALLELLDLMSGPVLLIQNSPAREWRETAPGK